MHLNGLGWNTFFQQHWKSIAEEGWEPARVVEEQREAYRVVAEVGEMAAEVTGRFRHSVHDTSGFPSVGDWVAISVQEGQPRAQIHFVLRRRTKLSRKVAGQRSLEQVLVANVDTVLAVASLNSDLSPRRVERFLSTIRESGARPVLVLNKADLCADTQFAISQIAAVASGVNVHVVSARTGEGFSELAAYTGPGATVVLVGSSGVGKSTMINRLLESDVQATGEIRSADDTGKHTTSYRRLFALPGGGVLIDTPGIRELQLWDVAEGLEDSFDDIAKLAAGCRFRNCGHGTEPGCVVRDVVDASRLESYQKLKLELLYLEARRDAAAQAQRKKTSKQRNKALKLLYKEKE